MPHNTLGRDLALNASLVINFTFPLLEDFVLLKVVNEGMLCTFVATTHNPRLIEHGFCWFFYQFGVGFREIVGL